jgi:hypothetical protein
VRRSRVVAAALFCSAPLMLVGCGDDAGDDDGDDDRDGDGADDGGQGAVRGGSESNGGRQVFRGNRIDGNLQCEGNRSRPRGSGNRVDGDKEGQCRGL